MPTLITPIPLLKKCAGYGFGVGQFWMEISPGSGSVLGGHQHLGYGQRACSMRDTEVALDEAVRDFAMRWVDSLYGGWENDDGACGTVTINVHDDAIHLEHTTYYTESSSYEHSL